MNARELSIQRLPGTGCPRGALAFVAYGSKGRLVAASDGAVLVGVLVHGSAAGGGARGVAALRTSAAAAAASGAAFVGGVVVAAVAELPRGLWQLERHDAARNRDLAVWSEASGETQEQRENLFKLQEKL